MKKPPGMPRYQGRGFTSALRALRQRISLFRADSFYAKLAKDRKARGAGVVSKEGRPYMIIVTEYQQQ